MVDIVDFNSLAKTMFIIYNYDLTDLLCKNQCHCNKHNSLIMAISIIYCNNFTKINGNKLVN